MFASESTILNYFMSATTTLNTTNAQHLIYENSMLTMEILGGIRLDGLDRLRVTLKITVEHLSLRHNLDLYNDNQVEKLIRKVAERLAVGTSVVAAALMDLTGKLEAYRLTEREKQETKQTQRKLLTLEEINAAQRYLSAPNLMARTREDIGHAGVIGEEDNRLLMYLIFTSRKRERPLHIISLGSSGIGKTHLQSKVAELIPPEDRVEATGLSDMALYYFGQTELRHKLLLFEDLDGAFNALFPIRELQSKTRITRPVVHKNTRGETKTINLVVEGPVSIAGCTTKESLYEDNANRSFLIYIDESLEQDEKIMAYQRKLSAGKIELTEEYQMAALLQNTQRLLQPIQVRNPYAEHLKIPPEVFKPRRTNAHYLAFIEAVTFYHQYQREKQYDTTTGEAYITTTLEDIAAANQLMKTVLLRKSDPLNGATRNYFEKLKTLINNGAARSDHPPGTFTNAYIRQYLRIKGTTLRRYHNALLDVGMITIHSGKPATGYTYQIVDPDEYRHLQTHITQVLDEMLAHCGRATTPGVSYTKNGSPKAKKTNAVSAVRYAAEKRQASKKK